MQFEVKGNFRLGEKYQDFNIKVNASNEKSALESVYKQLGSNHKCKRRFIKIEGVSVAKKK